MPLSAGSRLGPYEILQPIGAGGMGEVYKARDTRLGRDVAIKVLPALLAADPQFRDRFEREAKSISQLTHPNICTLYDVGETPSASRFGRGDNSGSRFVPRHGVSRGRHAGGARGERRVAAGRRAAHRDRDRLRPRQSPPPRHRPSRPEAGQRHADEVRVQAPRLRAGEDGRHERHRRRRTDRPGRVAAAHGPGSGAHGPGHDPRHVSVHGAGTNRRRRGRRARGHLRVRRRPLRDGHGPARVFRQEPGEPAGGHPGARAAAGLATRARRAARARLPRAHLPRERSRTRAFRPRTTCCCN